MLRFCFLSYRIKHLKKHDAVSFRAIHKLLCILRFGNFRSFVRIRFNNSNEKIEIYRIKKKKKNESLSSKMNTIYSFQILLQVDCPQKCY